MAHMGNIYQSRIGQAGSNGTALPETKAGDEVVVFAVPEHWHGQETPSVTISVNLHAAQLTAAEARRLAKALLDHANQAESAG
ncbi:hypothetical protein [Roseovarius sp. MMSF_3281]|uniref:hypothetical protein n=1 Tax=Roseovarius sp. MMSF_3281 TaxID=3046694 RepID=UPI00273F269E|nr:hypothetical protein [Roseovarius sp. MMSF_3281]